LTILFHFSDGFTIELSARDGLRLIASLRREGWVLL